MFHEPRSLKRSIFNAIVAPRPIGWVSTIGANGGVNLAPFSHFNMVSTAPAALMFSCNTRDDRTEKDTIANVRATGEFVTSLVSRDLLEAMNLTSTAVPHGSDEFELAGLARAASIKVRPPRVADSPAAFECRLLKLVEIDPEEDGDTPSIIVIGRIIGVHIADGFLTPTGRFDTAGARPMSRLGGAQYAELGPIIELAPPFAKVGHPNS